MAVLLVCVCASEKGEEYRNYGYKLERELSIEKRCLV